MKEEQYKPSKDLPLEYEPVDLPEDELIDEPIEEQHYFEFFILFMVSLLCAFLLFASKETVSFGNLFTIEKIISALIFAVPSFATSSYLFEKMIKSYDKNMSLLLSLVISIPLIFLLLMKFFTI